MFKVELKPQKVPLIYVLASPLSLNKVSRIYLDWRRRTEIPHEEHQRAAEKRQPKASVSAIPNFSSQKIDNFPRVLGIAGRKEV